MLVFNNIFYTFSHDSDTGAKLHFSLLLGWYTFCTISMYIVVENCNMVE